MANRNTLERDIEEILGAPTAAEAHPREIDWEPAPDPVQAFEDLRDFSEEPEEPEESDDEDGSDEDDEDDE
ncbi:MAG: hypothetical protein L0206_12760 [Actinobacteria bacterium]|nr:hypothetical protein [Actinomycetota bacterium]